MVSKDWTKKQPPDLYAGSNQLWLKIYESAKKNGLFSLKELDIIAAFLPQGLTNDYGYGYI